MDLFDVEVILAIDIDMCIPCGPDMREITVLHRIAFLLELVHHGCHVDRIPDNDGIGDQIETQGLMGEGLPVALPELALVGHDQSGLWQCCWDR